MEAGRAYMSELMDVYLALTRANSGFKPATIVSRETALKKLEKTWPGIGDLQPKQITPASILDWTPRPSSLSS